MAAKRYAALIRCREGKPIELLGVYDDLEGANDWAEGYAEKGDSVELFYFDASGAAVQSFVQALVAEEDAVRARH